MKHIIILITFFFFSGCKSVTNENDDIAFIKHFYDDYNAEVSKEDISISKRDAILKTYCTTRLFTFLNKQYRENELDWDPFLNAQDTNIKTTETLKIKKVKSNYNLYTVSYLWAPTGEIIDKIGLIIIYENGKPKIDFVYIGKGFEDPKYKDVEII